MSGGAAPRAARVPGTPYTVSADRDSCQGHARCWEILPDLFPIDDEGYTGLGRRTPVPEGREEQARRAVDSCPERALSMNPVAGHR